MRSVSCEGEASAVRFGWAVGEQASIRDGPPAVGHVEGQGEAGLQVWLVHDRQRVVRAVRYEQRVQEVVLPVERPVSELDLQVHLVPGAVPEGASGDHEVVVHDVWLQCLAVDTQAAHPLARILEVDHDGQARRVVPIEPQGDGARERLAPLARHAHVHVVLQRADGGRAVLGQGQRDAGRHHLGGHLLRARRRGDRQQGQ
jgi:hypothetical protein